MITSRRGVSLVELLIVMSGCTVVLALSSQLVCRIMRCQMDSRAQESAERNSLRLAIKFRQDVHAAQAAETDKQKLGEELFLRLKRDDGWQAEYSFHNGNIVRETGGDDRHLAREDFAFPETCALSLESIGTPQRLRLSLTTNPRQAMSALEKEGKATSIVPAVMQAEALLGRDLRFREAASPEKDAT